MTNKERIIRYAGYSANYDEILRLHEQTGFLTQKQYDLLKKQESKFKSADEITVSHGQTINIIMKFEKIQSGKST